MRLRSLLGLFAIGMAFLPLSLILTAGLLFETSDRKSPQASPNLHIMQMVLKAIDIDVTGRIVADPEYSIPDGIRLLVCDSEGTILLSSFPDVRTGMSIDDRILSSLDRSLSPEYRFLADSLTIDGKIVGTYAARFPSRGLELTSNPALAFIIAASPLILAIMAFGASGIISARLVGTFRNFEKAALRIAEGDLETAVPAHRIREISAFASAMESMRNSLRENESRRARFLAGISHDLRTPLTSIKGFLEAVSDGLAEDPETLKRYVSIMEEKADVLENRITELLELSRMQTGEWRLRLEELDLGPFLERLAAGYAEDAAALGRTFSSDIRLETGTAVPADLKMFSRALENVFTNALRYAPPESSVRLSAYASIGVRTGGPQDRSGLPGRAADRITITLEDNGPGIPQEELEKIFEPYFRGKTSRGEESGLGLGLSIARSIIRDHGWEITASTATGGGSIFTITIPRT